MIFFLYHHNQILDYPYRDLVVLLVSTNQNEEFHWDQSVILHNNNDLNVFNQIDVILVTDSSKGVPLPLTPLVARPPFQIR